MEIQDISSALLPLNPVRIPPCFFPASGGFPEISDILWFAAGLLPISTLLPHDILWPSSSKDTTDIGLWAHATPV